MTTIFLTLHVAGHLNPRWAAWFDGLDIRHLPDGTTELRGTIADQAALYGQLNRARDLGLTLLVASARSVAQDGDSN
jgi:hypothetical protein